MTKKIPHKEYLPGAISSCVSDKSNAATVLDFSKKYKEKRLSEAKRRVHHAASKLNW